MSLFPAYAGGNEEESSSLTANPTAKTQWLENSSFNISEQEIVPILNNAELDEQDNGENETKQIPMRKPKKKSKKKKHKKKLSEKVAVTYNIDFKGDEEYYIDKNGCSQYRTINTLHKPACPRYRSKFHCTLGKSFQHSSVKRSQRYYKSELCREAKIKNDQICPLDENSFTQATTNLNRKISQSPCEVSYWVDLVILQDKNPYKWSKTFLSEKKLEILQRALFHHLGNESLYRLYVDIINTSYPSFEVSKIIDKLISKDPYNYVLWTAQILTTQCTMARCIVPDVLKIYEQCMQKMHKKLQDDRIMLKLFNNCALFLRQAGLNEQFIALIKLALELNVSPDKFSSLQPLEKDQQALVEYEELILQSGLPMNEIWLRIEKLRQSFNFLPCPENTKCSDPQRVVYNEDICYYIYPLIHRENSFYLILIILRLLKIPIISSDSLRNRFQTKVENIGDTDAIEDVLAVFLHKFNFHEGRYKHFYEVIFELCKEMCVCPSFLNTTIGFEIYSNSIQEILIICAECFEQIDERKRTIFILIWLRFERILLILQNLSNKVDTEYKRKLRSKIKNFFRKEQNRNVLNFYTEYALLEYELGEVNNCKGIFEQILTGNDHENLNSDLSNAYLTYAIILLKENQNEKALKVLMSYALNMTIESLEENVQFTEVRKLSGLKKLTDRLNSLIAIEKNVSVMELEQYFLPDYLINLIGMRTWYQYIIGNKMEAMAFLETALKQIIEDNERHKFLREHIYELMISLMQCDSATCIVSNVLYFGKISQALNEFPENLLLLQCCSSMHTQPWYKIRGLVLQSNSILSIIFLITIAKMRFIQSSQTIPDATLQHDQHNENMYKNRMLNILKSLDSTTVFKRNALYWRFYMRCLSDSRTSFETTKKCLLTALDDCPWNKAIYMDGAIFVPQELPHLQDLLIEKQLRVYALPEELEILRANDVQI